MNLYEFYCVERVTKALLYL